MERFLKCVSLPAGKRHAVGFNLKGDYLQCFGFSLGDKVKVELSTNKIVITKEEQSQKED